MSERIVEVYKASNESKGKYIYFLLAAAAAAIALAVRQTSGVALDWSQTPLAIAVVLWGVSFFAGCRHIMYVNANFYSNMHLIEFEEGTHPDIKKHGPHIVDPAVAGIREALEWNSNRANLWSKWQFWLLIAGAVSFLVWHVFEMYLAGAIVYQL